LVQEGRDSPKWMVPLAKNYSQSHSSAGHCRRTKVQSLRDHSGLFELFTHCSQLIGGEQVVLEKH